jgi:hypothetical protein
VKKRKRLQEPNERVLNIARTGDCRKEDRVTEDNSQAPASNTSEANPILAHGELREERESRSWSEKSLKKEECKEKNPPDPEVLEKLLERQSREDEKAKKQDGIEGKPCDFRLEKGRGDHQESEEFASGIPAMKRRIPGKIVKRYSSHEIFSLPRRA